MSAARRAATALLASAILACAASACRPKAKATPAMADFPALEVGRLAEPGLELVRCYLPADPAVRRDGLASLAATGVTPLESPLAREGFTLLVVPNARLREVAETLGGSPATRRTFLGQPDAWLDLATETVARGRPYFRGGRPVEGDGSILHLDLRGWCFPTVDDGRARLELRLSEDRGRVNSVSMDPSEVRVRRQTLPDALAVLELAPGESLVILANPPAPPEEGDGPTASVPPTLAGVLLPGTPFPDRVTMLVVAPSFADILPKGAANPAVADAARAPRETIPPDPAGGGASGTGAPADPSNDEPSRADPSNDGSAD
jgi:hypothetical protein